MAYAAFLLLFSVYYQYLENKDGSMQNDVSPFFLSNVNKCMFYGKFILTI